MIFLNIFYFYQTQMANRKYTQGFKKNLIALVLNLQNKRDKFMEKFCEHLDTLSNTIDNLSSKLDLVESSLVATKTVNDKLLNCVTTLERRLHVQEQLVEENVLILLASQVLAMIKISEQLCVTF